MIARTVGFAVTLVATLASTSLAQQKERIGPFAADVRLVSSALPTEAGWTPQVPVDALLPGRGLGVDAGAHLYLIRGRAVALGVGASLLTARGASSTPAPESGSGPAVPLPDVTTRVTILSPQVSLNFGHSLGWSYLSAGLGRTRVRSEAAGAGALAAAARDSDWVKTLNFGGGARWFLNDHVGIGFDVRWYKVSLLPATATHPGAGRASIMAAGAGIVLK